MSDYCLFTWKSTLHCPASLPWRYWTGTFKYFPFASRGCWRDTAEKRAFLFPWAALSVGFCCTPWAVMCVCAGHSMMRTISVPVLVPAFVHLQPSRGFSLCPALQPQSNDWTFLLQESQPTSLLFLGLHLHFSNIVWILVLGTLFPNLFLLWE